MILQISTKEALLETEWFVNQAFASQYHTDSPSHRNCFSQCTQGQTNNFHSLKANVVWQPGILDGKQTLTASPNVTIESPKHLATPKWRKQSLLAPSSSFLQILTCSGSFKRPPHHLHDYYSSRASPALLRITDTQSARPRTV